MKINKDLAWRIRNGFFPLGTWVRVLCMHKSEEGFFSNLTLLITSCYIQEHLLAKFDFLRIPIVYFHERKSVAFDVTNVYTESWPECMFLPRIVRRYPFLYSYSAMKANCLITSSCNDKILGISETKFLKTKQTVKFVKCTYHWKRIQLRIVIEVTVTLRANFWKNLVLRQSDCRSDVLVESSDL